MDWRGCGSSWSDANNWFNQVCSIILGFRIRRRAGAMVIFNGRWEQAFMDLQSGAAGTAVGPIEPVAPEEADVAEPGQVEEIKAQQRQTESGKYCSVEVTFFTPPERQGIPASRRGGMNSFRGLRSSSAARTTSQSPASGTRSPCPTNRSPARRSTRVGLRGSRLLRPASSSFHFLTWIKTPGR